MWIYVDVGWRNPHRGSVNNIDLNIRKRDNDNNIEDQYDVTTITQYN